MNKHLAYILILICILLSGCSTQQKQKPIRTINDVVNKRIIVISGSNQEAYMMKNFPNTNIIHVQNNSDVYVALKANKGDVVLDENTSVEAYSQKQGGIDVAIDSVYGLPVGIAFSPNNTKLQDKFNVFLKDIETNGILKEMKDRWMNSKFTSSNKSLPYIPNKGKNGILHFGCTGVDYPFSFMIDGSFSGFDVELATRFAAKMGMKLNVQTLIFPSLIAAACSNKVDFIGGCIAITKERAKKMAFSNPYMSTKTSAVVLSLNKNTDTSFITSVKKDFYNTFIQDNRYQLLVDGIGCTIEISILSVLFGTLLGFLICWMRMSSHKWLVDFTKAYIYIFRGIPQVVLLMLLFYVVFASSRLNGVVVSIIGFSITFSAYVCEMFRSSIESVNKGQNEACLAMGFTPFQAFRYITFPITVQRVFPVYIGEVIALIKSTSIVGYIAVEDLTKMSDMIRSLTFDAFFSLIVVTIIYFILIVLTISGLKTLQKKTAPKRNKFYKP